MIGFYNVSVILTYIGLASSVFGITRAINGNFYAAILCLLISGVCDMFDGKIARATKRSRPAMIFGIQIDSLCDLVCFGVFPAVICYCAGADSAVSIIVLILFVLAAVIRLGYFNVTEQQRQEETDENRKYYQGLPVTAIGLLLPLASLFKNLFLHNGYSVFLTAFMLAVAVLNVLNFKLKKPGGKASVVLIVIGAARIFVHYHFFLLRDRMNTDGSINNKPPAGGRMTPAQWLRRTYPGGIHRRGRYPSGVSGGVLCVTFGLLPPLMALLAHPKKASGFITGSLYRSS